MPIELRNDKDLAILAVSIDVFSLLHVSDELKDDSEVVSMAVEQYGNSLE